MLGNTASLFQQWEVNESFSVSSTTESTSDVGDDNVLAAEPGLDQAVGAENPAVASAIDEVFWCFHLWEVRGGFLMTGDP